MKQILTIVAVFAILTAYTQECSVTAIGLHYVVPRGAGVDIIKSGKFQVGIGLMYNSLTTKEKGESRLNYDLQLLAFGGVRVYHKEYRTAMYTNIGYVMGDLYGPQLYLSTKLMLLRNQKAFSFEPYYANRWGFKLGIYILI